MWQKDDEEINWSKKHDSQNKSTFTPHSDYFYNLNYAKTIINSEESNLNERIMFGVDKSKYLFCISWKPPTGFRFPSFGNQISLHQSKESFSRKVENTLIGYAKERERFEKRFGPIEPL